MLGPYVSVLAVFPDSPAESAGLLPGDRLLSVNGTRIPEGPRAAIFAAKRVEALLLPGEVNELEIMRAEETLRLEVEPVAGVYYAVVVVPSNAVTLHVDGDVIWIGMSLVESLRDKDELAYLCAYALAKNVMSHPKQKGKNALLGQVLDVAAAVSGVNTGGLFGGMGGSAYSHGFEVEADLIALYLLASSSYPYSGYPEYWERILKSRSRKGTLTAKESERIEIMGKVIASIEEKIEAEKEIFPEEYLQGDISEIE